MGAIIFLIVLVVVFIAVMVVVQTKEDNKETVSAYMAKYRAKNPELYRVTLTYRQIEKYFGIMDEDLEREIFADHLLGMTKFHIDKIVFNKWEEKRKRGKTQDYIFTIYEKAINLEQAGYVEDSLRAYQECLELEEKYNLMEPKFIQNIEDKLSNIDTPW